MKRKKKWSAHVFYSTTTYKLKKKRKQILTDIIVFFRVRVLRVLLTFIVYKLWVFTTKFLLNILLFLLKSIYITLYFSAICEVRGRCYRQNLYNPCDWGYSKWIARHQANARERLYRRVALWWPHLSPR